MINKSSKLISYLVAGLVASVFTSGNAQTGSSIHAGIYTQEQAVRGEASYAANCASCHSQDLRGNSNTPSLLGMSFMFIWENQSLGQLYSKMRDEMPSDRPGSLSAQTYADLIAFILRANQFPAGQQELTGDMTILEQISITSK